jgi:hypothetical protein
MHELDFDSLQLMNGTPADPGAVAVAAALLPGEPCGPRSAAFLGGACLPQFGQIPEDEIGAQGQEDCKAGEVFRQPPGQPGICVTNLVVDCLEGEIPTAFGCAPAGTIPGAVTVRPANWDLSTEPAEYILAAGDTMVGLATTYLFQGARWRDIWDVQTPSFRAANTPDVIFAGDTIRMPNEARDNFVKFLKKEEPPPGGILPGKPQGPVPKTEQEEARSRTLLFLAAGAAVAGVVMIAAAKKPRRTRRRRG